MIRAFGAAVQFLTRLPLRTRSADASDVVNSYYFYPVVGLLIGLAGVAVRRLAATLFPSSFSVVVLLSFLILLTGGLHEDGLADVADGMGGGWTLEDRLRIMKDSHIGTFGALALVVVMLGKYSALTS